MTSAFSQKLTDLALGECLVLTAYGGTWTISQTANEGP
jgi:hypothetical protein